MPDRRLFLQASTISQYVGQIVEQTVTPLGLPGFLLALLFHLRENARVTPSAIAALSGTPATTLRDNIQRLVDAGLARRIPNPDDGRSYLIELTTKGEQVARDVQPALLEAYLALEQRLEQPLSHYQEAFAAVTKALESALAELTSADIAAAGSSSASATRRRRTPSSPRRARQPPRR